MYLIKNNWIICILAKGGGRAKNNVMDYQGYSASQILRLFDILSNSLLYQTSVADGTQSLLELFSSLLNATQENGVLLSQIRDNLNSIRTQNSEAYIVYTDSLVVLQGILANTARIPFGSTSRAP
jgi:hypothetical protein